MGKPGLGSGKIMHGSLPCGTARRRFLGLGLAVVLCAFLAACAHKAAPPKLPSAPPVTSGESAEVFLSRLAPANQELSGWKDMAPTVRKSLLYVNSKPQGALAIDRPGLKVTWGELSRTLRRLQELLPRLDADPGLLAQNFRWVPVPKGIDYSGYYEPRVAASRTKKPGYEQPIYAVPPDLAKVKARRGRYYDRRTIEEKQVLAGRGLELAWAADPVDVFFLEIQGSGRLV
ncbi:MAG: MltA domain-containing protein, partial [Desulfovibrio sp.]|nr:MltA domain-containing protein [Desulfovibrio sp.]